MAESLDFIPTYISPLTDKEHATIGRIALLWGQVEYIIDELLCLVSGLSWNEPAIGEIKNKEMSQKIRFLKKEAEQTLEPNGADILLSFCQLINATKSARNAVFHGIWGWRADRRKRIVFPAARKSRAPSQPFPASKLSWLEKQLCRCSRMGGELCDEFRGYNTRFKYQRFIHHNAREPKPEWLLQWSERYPLDSKILNRAVETGQLPRFDNLFPER